MKKQQKETLDRLARLIDLSRGNDKKLFEIASQAIADGRSGQLDFVNERLDRLFALHKKYINEVSKLTLIKPFKLPECEFTFHTNTHKEKN